MQIDLRAAFDRVHHQGCHDLGDPYSIVWDWRVSRAEPTPFYWISCSLAVFSPLVINAFSFKTF